MYNALSNTAIFRQHCEPVAHKEHGASLAKVNSYPVDILHH